METIVAHHRPGRLPGSCAQFGFLIIRVVLRPVAAQRYAALPDRCILPAKMKLRQKRPVGITILAAAFLWIGCLGTLFFPGFLLSGGTTSLWQQIADGVIHSQFWLRLTSSVFAAVSFLLYVAYAFIGFGLWKLRNWARIAILALAVLGAVVGALAEPFFIRPGTLAVAVVTGTVLPFAWIIWYLKRPRVCFAFQAAPYIPDGASTAEPPHGLSKKGKAWVTAAIMASFALFCVPLSVAIENEVGSLEIYKVTLKKAQNSPCVTEKLGVPITPRWGAGGSWQEGNTDGTASLNIPVRGPKGKGRLEMSAEKQKGVWKITSLVLVHESERTQIEPSVPNSSCQ